MVFSEAEKLEIVEIYVKNNKNRYRARQEYINIYGNNGNRRIPSLNTFKNVYNLFRSTKTLKRRKRTGIVNEEAELEILLYFIGKFYKVVIK